MIELVGVQDLVERAELQDMVELVELQYMERTVVYGGLDGAVRVISTDPTTRSTARAILSKTSNTLACW